MINLINPSYKYKIKYDKSPSIIIFKNSFLYSFGNWFGKFSYSDKLEKLNLYLNGYTIYF